MKLCVTAQLCPKTGPKPPKPIGSKSQHSQNQMIRPITLAIALSYPVFELYLLATMRGAGKTKSDDRGTIISCWALILGSIAVGFLAAHVFPGLHWPRVPGTAVMANLLIISGMVLRSWAIRHLGRFFTVDVGTQGGQKVVQDGPYTFVRHPSYTGSLISLAGIACLTFNWLGFAVIIAGCLAAYWIRISVEERVLTSNLGDEYRRYSARTKRLIPGIL